MRVTIRKGQHIQLTAATYAEVFKHLVEDKYKDMAKTLWFNSLDKHKNRLEDAKMEFISYLAHRYAEDQNELVRLFNQPSFADIVHKSLALHVSTREHPFNRRYSFDGGKKANRSGAFYQQVELDDPNTDLILFQKEHEMDQFEDTSLSISQFVQVVRFLLRTEGANRFSKEDKDFYFEFFIVPISQGKKITIKQVAIDKKLDYKNLLQRIKPIKQFIKKEIQPFI